MCSIDSIGRWKLMERSTKGRKCKEGLILLGLSLIGALICIWPLKSIMTQTTLGATTSDELKTSGGMTVSVDHLSKSKEGKCFVTFTLTNEKGMPQGVQHIVSAWIINVEANGHKYRLLQKQPSQDVHIIEKTEKKITYVEEAKLCKKVNNKWKEVQDGLDVMNGLNASVYTDPHMLLDSIGFVNGKLHLITSKVSEGELYFVITDSEGKKISTVYIADYSKDLEYQVIDISDLTGCKVEAIQYISYGEEKTPSLDLKVPFKIVVK